MSELSGSRYFKESEKTESLNPNCDFLNDYASNNKSNYFSGELSSPTWLHLNRDEGHSKAQHIDRV